MAGVFSQIILEHYHAVLIYYTKGTGGCFGGDFEHLHASSYRFSMLFFSPENFPACFSELFSVQLNGYYVN